MKRILSLLLCLTLMFGAMTALCGIQVCAQADYDAELWSPVEITLTSSVSYKKPYMEAEIDAVFTHEDGTQIKVPGFCKDGNSEWAVRFSPTKTGKWTYSITCSDASNTGLTQTGTVNAVESTKDTEIAKHGFVKVSDNKRYYTYADGTPFFWLGDTNWQAPNYVSASECNYPGCNCGSQIEHEVKDRVSKGFTVYQTYFSPTTSGLWASSYTRPDYNEFNERIDKIFETINNYGMVIALGFGLHSATPTNIKDKDLLRFVRYCMARYGCYNIVWITGQEITETQASATKGKTCMDVWMEVGELVDKLDGYQHPNGAHMYVIKSTDDCAKRLDQAAWHELWILQGGHGGSVQTKGFYQSYWMNMSGTVKPYIEGENNYEDINCGGYTGYDANRWNAWKSTLCGCCGFTYGASGVWINAKDNHSDVCYGEDISYSYDPWYIGLGKPGSYEVQFMREFYENIDWWTLVPRFNDPAYNDFSTDETKVMSSNEDGTLAAFYFYDNENNSTGLARKLSTDKELKGYWYDVLTGKYIPVELNVKKDGTCKLPQRPDAQDWVLLITSEPLKHDFYEGKLFTDLGQGEITGEITQPVTLDAIGGITYGIKKNEPPIDNTSYLTDNDPSTIWTPNANRVAQTFIYDLGEAKELTHVVITPAPGTILRKLRVYASNDGKRWDIIVNNMFRDNYMNGDSISEKLAGGYRYVKLMLMPAESIALEDADSQSFKTIMNGKTNEAYSALEIADIALYTNGTSANPVQNIITTTSGGGSSTSNDGLSTGAIIGIVAGVGGLIIVGAAVFVVVTLKKGKKKEN